jgi:hypothetical protein
MQLWQRFHPALQAATGTAASDAEIATIETA